MKTSEHIELLQKLAVAMNDWIVTYAQEFCEVSSFEGSMRRIYENGGTLAYASDLRGECLAAVEILRKEAQSSANDVPRDASGWPIFSDTNCAKSD